MVIEAIQTLPALADNINHWNQALGGLNPQFQVDWLFFAQDVSNTPDILANIQNAWSKFVSTGQIWAMLIGIFFGYLFKSMTSF
jgi:hypothetical protein